METYNKYLFNHHVFYFLLVFLTSVWSYLRFQEILNESILITDTMMIGIFAFISLINILLLLSIASKAYFSFIKTENIQLKISWIIFAFFLLFLFSQFPGYRISSIGVVSYLNDFDVSIKNSYKALENLFPLHPCLSFLGGVTYLSGHEVIVGGKISPYFKSENLFFYFSGISLISLIFLIVSKRNKNLSLILLILSASYLLILISNNLKIDNKLFYLIGVNLSFYTLILLFYASILIPKKTTLYDKLLPPSLIVLILFSWPLLLIYGDIYNRFNTVINKQNFNLSFNSKNKTNENSSNKYIIEALLLNVRNGPGIKFEVVEQKKFGDVVNGTIEKDGWVKISENKWLSKNFLNNERVLLYREFDNMVMELNKIDKNITIRLGRNNSSGKISGIYSYNQKEWLLLKSYSQNYKEIVFYEYKPSGENTGKLYLQGDCISKLIDGDDIDSCKTLKGKWVSVDNTKMYQIKQVDYN